jgi:hypothetical protein
MGSEAVAGASCVLLWCRAMRFSRWWGAGGLLDGVDGAVGGPRGDLCSSSLSLSFVLEDGVVRVVDCLNEHSRCELTHRRHAGRPSSHYPSPQNQPNAFPSIYSGIKYLDMPPFTVFVSTCPLTRPQAHARLKLTIARTPRATSYGCDEAYQIISP